MKTIYGNLGGYHHSEEYNNLAKKLVGDGKTKKFFISVSNQVLRPDTETGDTEYEPVNGKDYKMSMFKCTSSKIEALSIAEDITLDADMGICSVQVEGAEGQVYERVLEERIEVTYSEILL